MTEREIRHLLRVKACEVGLLLNALDDDDARERAQEDFERVLNRELFLGSRARHEVATGTSPLLAALRAVNGDNRAHSVRVELLEDAS